MTAHRVRPVLIGKMVPAPLPPHTMARKRITSWLAEAPRRRVTALTAGAGFGKTTSMTLWAENAHCAWYTLAPDDSDAHALARGIMGSLALRAPALRHVLRPALDGAHGPDAKDQETVEALVPALAAALHTALSSDVTLVLDDLHELAEGSTGLRLVADLCHMAPRRLHLLLASRTDLPFPVTRLRLSGQLQVLTAESLRFDQLETADLLAAVGGVGLGEHAAAVAHLTGGWPAAVRLVAEHLGASQQPLRALDRLLATGGAAPLIDELLEADLAVAPPATVSMLRVGAALTDINPELLEALEVPGAGASLAAERRRGIHLAAGSVDGWHTLTPISREYVLDHLTNRAEIERSRRSAAQWHLSRGQPAEALRYLCRTADHRATADLLARYGHSLLAAGHVGTVTDALATLPAEHRSAAAIDLVEGEACEVRGDWDRAAQCLQRLVPDPPAPAPAAACWRLGLIHHMRGEPGRALALYQRGVADAGAASRDRAMSAAWGSAAAWLMGDAATCRRLVDTAESLASGDDQVLAAVHTARALLAALDGDRRGNDMHYLKALEHAERAGDVLQVIRIRTNRGSRLLEEGYYAEAMSELDAAIELAELAGYATLHALALCNRGDAARRIGRLHDAARDLRSALAIQQRIGSRMAGYALTSLGAVYADRGETTLARASYEEAVELAEPSGDLQGMLPALAGLARVVAPDDRAFAAELITRAESCSTHLANTAVLLAAGWVAQSRGDADAAGRYATRASDTARARRDRAGVAEALELQAAAERDSQRRGDLLVEAETMWQVLGCPLPLARTRLALAVATMRSASARSASAAAPALAELERTFRDLGAWALAARAAALRSTIDGEAVPEVTIRTLGGFGVQRRGEVVRPAAWQSRKARDLLKILISRRGAPVPRDVACELLWPGVLPERASGRLSVALSTVRLVLDPGHDHPPDRYVVSGDGALRLRLDHLHVDLEEFLAAAASALARDDVAALTGAAELYAGEFCAEDQYADWAEPARDQARSLFVSVARALAEHHASRGDHEAAIRYLHRLLAAEPYDEQAHLAVVRELDLSGRHGDARRMYRTYAAKMAELELEMAPYPG